MLQIRTMNMWTRCVANALNIPDMLQQMFPTTILSDSHIQTEETLESTKAILEESLEIVCSPPPIFFRWRSFFDFFSCFIDNFAENQYQEHADNRAGTIVFLYPENF